MSIVNLINNKNLTEAKEEILGILSEAIGYFKGEHKKILAARIGLTEDCSSKMVAKSKKKKIEGDSELLNGVTKVWKKTSRTEFATKAALVDRPNG